jgi:hypothetical protein
VELYPNPEQGKRTDLLPEATSNDVSRYKRTDLGTEFRSSDIGFSDRYARQARHVLRNAPQFVTEIMAGTFGSYHPECFD